MHLPSRRHSAFQIEEVSETSQRGRLWFYCVQEAAAAVAYYYPARILRVRARVCARAQQQQQQLKTKVTQQRSKVCIQLLSRCCAGCKSEKWRRCSAHGARGLFPAADMSLSADLHITLTGAQTHEHWKEETNSLQRWTCPTVFLCCSKRFERDACEMVPFAWKVCSPPSGVCALGAAWPVLRWQWRTRQLPRATGWSACWRPLWCERLASGRSQSSRMDASRWDDCSVQVKTDCAQWVGSVPKSLSTSTPAGVLLKTRGFLLWLLRALTSLHPNTGRWSFGLEKWAGCSSSFRRPLHWESVSSTVCCPQSRYACCVSVGIKCKCWFSAKTR